MSDIRSDMQNRETYVGDAVYASYSAGMIKLRTSSDERGAPDNVIYIEPEVLTALVAFARQFWTVK